MQSSKSHGFKPAFDIPERLPDERVQELTQVLRDTGDKDVRDELISSHVRLALYLAGQKMGGRRSQDDLISAALFGLVQAVDWAPSRLHDNNITPYVAVTVKRFLWEHIQGDHLLSIDHRMYKKLKKELKLVPYFVTAAVSSDDEENPAEDECIEATIPVYNDSLPTEVDETFSFLCGEDKRLLLVAQRLVEGYKLVEIASEMGYTKQRVHQWVERIRERVRLWEKEDGNSTRRA